MKLDIVLKTWPNDYDWLPFLFSSMAKFTTGYDNLILVIEEQFPTPTNLQPSAIVKRCRQYAAGGQVESIYGVAIERLRAWSYSDADVIVFVDSDCAFIRPTNLKTDPFINAERPKVYYRTWEESGPAMCWKATTTNCLGFEPKWETMAGYPATYPRQVLVDLWNHLGGEERLRAIRNPTDLNVMGNYALEKAPGMVTPVHASEMAATACVKQFWSWHRAGHPDVQAEMKRIGVAG